LFEDDEGLLQKQRTIKDVLDGMTCKPVGGTALGAEFHHYKYCLGRYKKDGCGNFEPPAGENDRTGKGPGSMITWSRYEYNYKFYRHGHIGRNTKCSKCKELPPEQRPKKGPQSKLEQVKKRAPIGEFWDHYKQFINEKYRQHRWLLRALGKRYCGGLHRDPSRLLEMDAFGLYCGRDYMTG
jgi:hypothetical protein